MLGICRRCGTHRPSGTIHLGVGRKGLNSPSHRFASFFTGPATSSSRTVCARPGLPESHARRRCRTARCPGIGARNGRAHSLPNSVLSDSGTFDAGRAGGCDMRKRRFGRISVIRVVFGKSTILCRQLNHCSDSRVGEGFDHTESIRLLTNLNQ